MDILSRRVGVLVHKDESHQHPERFALKYYTRSGWSLKIRKLIVIRCWPVITIQMVSCAKVLLSEYITIGLQSLKNVLLGVPKK